MQFSIGLWSFVGAFGFVVLYLAGHMVRRFASYADRKNYANERVQVYIVIALILGFVAGSMFQSLRDTVGTCLENGGSVAECMLKKY